MHELLKLKKMDKYMSVLQNNNFLRVNMKKEIIETIFDLHPIDNQCQWAKSYKKITEICEDHPCFVKLNFLDKNLVDFELTTESSTKIEQFKPDYRLLLKKKQFEHCPKYAYVRNSIKQKFDLNNTGDRERFITIFENLSPSPEEFKEIPKTEGL